MTAALTPRPPDPPLLGAGNVKRLTVNVDQSVDDVPVPVDGGEVERRITLEMKTLGRYRLPRANSWSFHPSVRVGLTRTSQSKTTGTKVRNTGGGAEPIRQVREGRVTYGPNYCLYIIQ